MALTVRNINEDDDRLRVVTAKPQNISLRRVAEPKNTQQLRVQLKAPQPRPSLRVSQSKPQPSPQLNVAKPKPIERRLRVVGTKPTTAPSPTVKLRPTNIAPTNIRTNAGLSGNQLANVGQPKISDGKKNAVGETIKDLREVAGRTVRAINPFEDQNNQQIEREYQDAISNADTTIAQIINSYKKGEIDYNNTIRLISGLEQTKAESAQKLQAFKARTGKSAVASIGTAVGQGVARAPLQLSREIATAIKGGSDNVRSLQFEEGSLPAKIFGSEEIQNYTEELASMYPDATTASIGMAAFLFMLADVADVTGFGRAAGLSDEIATAGRNIDNVADAARLLDDLQIDETVASRYLDDIVAATDEATLTRLADNIITENAVVATARRATTAEQFTADINKQISAIRKVSSKKAGNEAVKTIRDKVKELGGADELVENTPAVARQSDEIARAGEEVAQQTKTVEEGAYVGRAIPNPDGEVYNITPRVADDIAAMPEINPEIRYERIEDLEFGQGSTGDINRARVEDYKNDIYTGTDIEPVVLFRENGKLIVDDGKHRLIAFKEAGVSDIPTIEVNTQGLLKNRTRDTAPTEAMSVDPATQKLIEEAKKYKSAEEFVKSQNIDENFNKDDRFTVGLDVKDSRLPDGYTIRKQHYDVIGDENFMGIEVFDKNEQRVAKLDFGMSAGGIDVKMIEVDKGERRKGIATAMLDKLQEAYPDVKIRPGMSTEDGSKLLKNYDFSKRKKQLTDIYNQAHSSGKAMSVDPQVSKAEQIQQPGVISIQDSSMQKLPKSLQEKIANSQPLFPEEVDQLHNSLQRQKMPIAEQQSLFEDMGYRQVKTIGDVAERTTPTGIKKSIAKGSTKIDKEFAELIKSEAIKEPTLTSVGVNRVFGKGGAKEARALINNLESIRRTNPKLADKMESFIYRPIVEMNAEAESIARRIRQSAIDVKNKHTYSKGDRALLRQLLDGQLGELEDAAQIVAKQADSPDAVMEMAIEMRRGYQALLANLNTQRQLVGKAPINPRKDYFPHIREMLEGDEFARQLKVQGPEWNKRVGSQFSFEKERLGKLQKIKEDPFEVYDIYIEAAKRNIATLVPAQNIDLVEKVLKEVGNEAKEWQSWFKKLGDEVSARTDVSNIIIELQGRYAAGVIMANAGSSAKNLIQPVITAGVTRSQAAIGLAHTTTDIFKYMRTGNIDELMTVGGRKSAYLESSYSQLDLRKVSDKNILERMGDTGAKVFYGTDMFGRKFVLESLYGKALKEIGDPAQALKVAERQAEALLPSRTPGTLTPLLRNNTFGRVAGLFQTEVIAQTEALIDVGRPGGTFSKTGKDVAANVAGIAVATYLYNEMYEGLFPGQRPAPDPIGWTQTAVEESNEEESGIVGALWSFTQQIGSQLPFLGSYFSEYSRSPLSIPIMDIVEDVTSAAAQTIDAVRNGEPVGPAITRFIRRASPFLGRGMGNVTKFVQGVVSYLRGGQDTVENGELERAFDIEQTPENFVRTAVGGPYNTPEAQAYFDGEPVTELDKFKEEQKEQKFDPLEALTPELQTIAETLNTVTLRQQAVDQGLITQAEFDAIENARSAPNESDIRDFPQGLDSASKNILTAKDVTEKEVFENSDTISRGGTQLLDWFTENFAGDTGFTPEVRNYVAEAVAYYNQKVAEKGLKDGSNKLVKLQQNMIRQVVDRTYDRAIGDIKGLTQDQIISRYQNGSVTDEQIQALLDASDFKNAMGVNSTKYKELRSELGLGYKFGSGSGSGGSRVRLKPRILSGKGTSGFNVPRVRINPRRQVRVSTSNRPGGPQSQPNIRIER